MCVESLRHKTYYLAILSRLKFFYYIIKQHINTISSFKKLYWRHLRISKCRHSLQQCMNVRQLRFFVGKNWFFFLDHTIKSRLIWDEKLLYSLGNRLWQESLFDQNFKHFVSCCSFYIDCFGNTGCRFWSIRIYIQKTVRLTLT